jgi:hypothetical protein
MTNATMDSQTKNRSQWLVNASRDHLNKPDLTINAGSKKPKHKKRLTSTGCFST